MRNSSARASVSPTAMTAPVFPFSMTSSMPPTGVAITGTRAAMASMSVRGSPSHADVNAKTSKHATRDAAFARTPQKITLSWSPSGTPIPSENRPHVLFDLLFRQETADTLDAREAEFVRRASVLDSLSEEARRLNGALGADDRRKLDEYLTGIRDLERRVQDEKDWLRKPKPNVEALEFGKEQGLDPDKFGLEYRRYQRLMYDVIALALQTDSTRVISYLARMDGSDGTGSWRDMGNPYNYHEMTHHGEDPDKLKWFTQADIWYMEDWAYFLGKLKSIKEGDGTLLDHTLVAYGSSGGSINAHHNHHLPTMLAGGSRLGIEHQGHIVKEDVRLGNLWSTIFDRMQVPLPKNFQGGEADGIIEELV